MTPLLYVLGRQVRLVVLIDQWVAVATECVVLEPRHAQAFAVTVNAALCTYCRTIRISTTCLAYCRHVGEIHCALRTLELRWAHNPRGGVHLLLRNMIGDYWC